ncbi:MAG TPA: sigma factor-like helix-turn-helix DNA-binding protein, partial [Telluria sp.]|nr:sigma factor-like helix-turn-helix DNA-binding protein [Telluria sp.]
GSLQMLERLSPEERAAFLLREFFDFDYARLSQALERSEGACRQLVSRARAGVKGGRARFAADESTQHDLIRRFIAATRTGDLDQIAALLSPDAELTADGGGKANTVLRKLHGAIRIARLFHVIARQVQRWNICQCGSMANQVCCAFSMAACIRRWRLILTRNTFKPSTSSPIRRN